MERHDAFLRQAVQHQFRDGRRDRHHHGVPVRDQLGVLLALRRRYFRRAVGARRIDGFFLESTFVGLFFFGWDRLSKRQHLPVTWLVAIGSNLSALWALIANGWMQNPVGSSFNIDTMRMELYSIRDVIFKSQVCTYGRGGLCHRFRVRARDFVVIFIARTASRHGASVFRHCFQFRPGVRALGGCAGGRKRLCHHRLSVARCRPCWRRRWRRWDWGRGLSSCAAPVCGPCCSRRCCFCFW